MMCTKHVFGAEIAFVCDDTWNELRSIKMKLQFARAVDSVGTHVSLVFEN